MISPFTWTELTSSASFDPRRAFRSQWFDNKIWLIYGCNYNGSTVYGDAYTSTDGITWSAAAISGLFVDCFYRSCIFNGEMYIMAGTRAGSLQDNVYKSSNGLSWSLVTNSPGWAARNNPATCVFDGKIWLSGGNQVSFSNRFSDVWYTSDGANWFQATANAIGVGFSAHEMYSVGSKLYITGGTLGNTIYSSSDGITWTEEVGATGLPAGLSTYPIAQSYGSGVLLMGEVAGQPMLYYTENGITWTDLSTTPMFTARRDGGFVTDGSSLYVFGGYTTAPDPDVAYNDSWLGSAQLTRRPKIMAIF